MAEETNYQQAHTVDSKLRNSSGDKEKHIHILESIGRKDISNCACEQVSITKADTENSTQRGTWNSEFKLNAKHYSNHINNNTDIYTSN